MGRLIVTLENRSPRQFFLFGLLMCAAVFAGTLLLGSVQNREAAVYEAEYRIAVAGRLVQAGLSEQETAEIVTAAPDGDSISVGESVMAGYGYRTGSPIGGEYAYSSHQLTALTSAAAVLLMLAVGTLLFHRVYLELRRLNRQLEHGEVIDPSDERDITLIGEAAEALRKKTKHLLSQLTGEKQYLADYLNDFSHQIKTPCTGLMLNNDILTSAPMPFEEQLDYFRRDRKCLERISQLVSESLKLARLDAGAVEYHIEPVDVSVPAAEAAAQLTAIALENGAEIVNTVERGITLPCDRLWLCEAISNLTKNAAEHSRGGQVRISAETDPMTVRIIIEDNGCGISEEDLPNVFRRFYSKSNSVSSGSVGIGMSIAKRIVEDMGGKIFIDSEVDKGTKITLEFLLAVT